MNKQCDGCIEDYILGGHGYCFTHYHLREAEEERIANLPDEPSENKVYTFSFQHPHGWYWSMYGKTKEEAIELNKIFFENGFSRAPDIVEACWTDPSHIEDCLAQSRALILELLASPN